MSESIQFTPSASGGVQKSKASSAELGAKPASGDDVEGFTAVFASYVDPETIETEQQTDENLAELLAALLPQDMLEAGKALPEQDKAAMWQVFMQLQPVEGALTNTGLTSELQGINLLDGQRKPVLNPSLLTKDYFQPITPVTPGLATNNITAQLAAAQFTPNTSEAFLLNINDQLVPSQGSGTSLLNGLAAVGFGSVTQAAATQTQMAPLNLGQNAWESNLGSRLQMLVGQNIQTAEIRLDPPELGALEIKIKVANDVATVNITSPHTQVREALEAAVPKLREMFAESGVSLGDVNVRQESFAQQQNSSEDGSELSRDITDSSDSDVTSEVPRQIVSNNMLDAYA